MNGGCSNINVGYIIEMQRYLKVGSDTWDLGAARGKASRLKDGNRDCRHLGSNPVPFGWESRRPRRNTSCPFIYVHIFHITMPLIHCRQQWINAISSYTWRSQNSPSTSVHHRPTSNRTSWGIQSVAGNRFYSFFCAGALSCWVQFHEDVRKSTAGNGAALTPTRRGIAVLLNGCLHSLYYSWDV